MHPVNAGLLALNRPRFVPSTPASAFHLLDRYLAGTGQDPGEVYRRSNVVIVGRSANVGRPAAMLAMQRGATVVSCDEHSARAGLLHAHTRSADILVVAAGVPGLLGGEHVKDGVIAVDVGINAVPDGPDGAVRLVGDLDFDSVRARARAITPVPGGVGPVTYTWLLHNTVVAARLRSGRSRNGTAVSSGSDDVAVTEMETYKSPQWRRMGLRMAIRRGNPLSGGNRVSTVGSQPSREPA